MLKNCFSHGKTAGVLFLMYTSALCSALPIHQSKVMDVPNKLVKRAAALDKLLGKAGNKVGKLFSREHGSFTFSPPHSGTTPLISPKAHLSPVSSRSSSPSGSSHGSIFSSSPKHSLSSSSSSTSAHAGSVRSSSHGGSSGHSSVGVSSSHGKSPNPVSPTSSSSHGRKSFGGSPTAQQPELSKYGVKTEKVLKNWSSKKYSDEHRMMWRDTFLKGDGAKAGEKADIAGEKAQRYKTKMEERGRGAKVTKVLSKIPGTLEYKAKDAQKTFEHQTRKMESIKNDASIHYANGNLKKPTGKEESVHQFVEGYRKDMSIHRALKHLDNSQHPSQQSGSSHGGGSSHSSTPRSTPPSSRGSSTHSNGSPKNPRGSPNFITFSP